jgi:hypothetical protein
MRGPPLGFKRATRRANSTPIKQPYRRIDKLKAGIWAGLSFYWKFESQVVLFF